MGKATGRLRRQGRQPAPVQGQLLLERRPREHRPGRDRDRARGEAEGHGRRVDGLPRRRHARRGRDVRVAQHRVALEAAGPLRRREQPLRAVDAGRARARRARSPARGAAFGIESAELDTTDVEEIHEAAGRAVGADPRDGRAVLPRPPHVPLQPALEGRTTTAIRPRSRSAGRATRCSSPARGSTTTSASAIEARCEERLAETVEAAEAAPAAAPGVAA